MSSHAPLKPSDWTLAASVFAFPALLSVVSIGVLAGALAGVHPLWQEPVLNVAEASALKDLGTIQRLIWTGADPNAPASVRPGILKSDTIIATPLEASVGTRTPLTMQFLLAHGARMDDGQRTVILCLAIEDKTAEILTFLQADGAQQMPQCERVATPW